MTAASGVGVLDNVVEAYTAIKTKKMYKYVTFKLNNTNTHVEVDQTAESGEYESFVLSLPDKECRYAVYDYEFSLGDAGKRQQLVFLVWCPEPAPIRQKMLYASSKDALKKKLTGLNHELQASDRSDLAQADLEERIKSKQVK